jgi:hypothetical protein
VQSTEHRHRLGVKYPVFYSVAVAPVSLSLFSIGYWRPKCGVACACRP